MRFVYRIFTRKNCFRFDRVNLPRGNYLDLSHLVEHLQTLQVIYPTWMNCFSIIQSIQKILLHLITVEIATIRIVSSNVHQEYPVRALTVQLLTILCSQFSLRFIRPQSVPWKVRNRFDQKSNPEKYIQMCPEMTYSQ